jgi:threonine/homoserine/homoserine lactone efflux protein
MIDLASFFVFITMMAFTPGPNNIMSMGNASRYGLRKSVRFNLGMWAGFSVVMLLCAIASAALEALIPRITLAMKIVGSAYMGYLAWCTLRANTHHGEVTEAGPTFTSGAILQFVNPKIYIYGFTAISSWALPATNNPIAIAGIALFLAFYGFCATLAWAAFGSVFSRAFAGNARLLNVILAILLVYCAVSLFL